MHGNVDYKKYYYIINADNIVTNLQQTHKLGFGFGVLLFVKLIIFFKFIIINIPNTSNASATTTITGIRFLRRRRNLLLLRFRIRFGLDRVWRGYIRGSYGFSHRIRLEKEIG
jgi:hypothetical protein